MRIKVLSGGRKSIELPLSDAELNFQMKRIGIEEIVPVCRLVEASEKDNPLCKFEGQTVKMDEVNFFAKRLDCFTEYERKVLYSYVTDYGVGTMQDLINLTFSMKGLSLITDFSDVEQVGKRLYLDEFIAIPEEEKQQTNFIKFAEKTFKESRVEVLPYGVFVEHGFEMQEVYNGKTFPEYFASDEIVAAIEVQNQAGDTEYLYLPTDICSMNKVKERLQIMPCPCCRKKEFTITWEEMVLRKSSFTTNRFVYRKRTWWQFSAMECMRASHGKRWRTAFPRRNAAGEWHLIWWNW